MNSSVFSQLQKIIVLALISLVSAFTSSAQNNNVGIGTSTPDASAALEIESSNQGFLPPRLSRNGIWSILNPKEGLVVYNTDAKTLNVFNGTDWVDMVGNILQLQIGDLYAGGIIFYLDGTGGGKVCATTDLATHKVWTTSAYQNIDVPANGAISNTDGYSNTNAIIAQAVGQPLSTYAAGLCRAYSAPGDGGLNDWYLPSKDELNQMWNNLADSDGNGVNTGPSDPNNLGDFALGFYWSSTSFSFDEADYVFFYDGFQNSQEKDIDNYVRAIRAF